VTQRGRVAVLLAIQLVLVLSIAAKYVYERKTCARVWVRTAQFDPNLAFRGRYLALRLALDACALPHHAENRIGPASTGMWRWRVKPEAKDGKLVAVPVGDDVRPELIQELMQPASQPCDRAVLQDQAD